MTPKTLIYYHRSYRKISGSAGFVLATLVVVNLVFVLAVFQASPLITGHMSRVAQDVLSSRLPSSTVTVVEKPFLLTTLSIVSLPGAYPSKVCTIIHLIVSSALILFLLRTKKRKNVAVYFLFLAAISLVSAVFFMVTPEAFPYTATEFSELYIKSQVSIWLFIPFVLGMALAPLPAPMLPKLLVMIFALGYSVVLGTLRYVTFLYIVSNFSAIYMALLYFAFGPLIDFVYIVGIYSFYISRLATKLEGSTSVWKWSY